MGNGPWYSLFPYHSIKHLDYWKSDHKPIVLEISDKVHAVKGGRRFHFENVWAEKRDFQELVQHSWEAASGRNVLLKVVNRLSNYAGVLQKWNSLSRGHAVQKINEKKKELALCNDSERERRRKIKVELDGLLKDEEIFWCQRSRVNWLREGDRNTKYFHAKASARRKRNQIFGLFDDKGSWVSADEDIEGIISDYFSSLYASSVPSVSQLNVVLNSVEARLPSKLKHFLDARFTRDEVKCALFQMSPSKAPGEDGFTAGFFQKYWGMVGEDVTNLCLDCLNNGRSVGVLNHSLL